MCEDDDEAAEWATVQRVEHKTKGGKIVERILEVPLNFDNASKPAHQSSWDWDAVVGSVDDDVFTAAELNQGTDEHGQESHKQVKVCFYLHEVSL